MPIIPIVKTSLFCATLPGKSLWPLAIDCKQADTLNVGKSQKTRPTVNDKILYYPAVFSLFDGIIQLVKTAQVDTQVGRYSL